MYVCVFITFVYRKIRWSLKDKMNLICGSITLVNHIDLILKPKNH